MVFVTGPTLPSFTGMTPAVQVMETSSELRGMSCDSAPSRLFGPCSRQIPDVPAQCRRAKCTIVLPGGFEYASPRDMGTD